MSVFADIAPDATSQAPGADVRPARNRLRGSLTRAALPLLSGRTTVFVTHSADEATFLGTRIVVLTRRPGRVALDLPARPAAQRRGSGRTAALARVRAVRAEVDRAVKAAAA